MIGTGRSGKKTTFFHVEKTLKKSCLAKRRGTKSEVWHLDPDKTGSKTLLALMRLIIFVDPHSFMQCLNQRCQPPDIVLEGKAMIRAFRNIVLYTVYISPDHLL